jgi:hypothetical protein
MNQPMLDGVITLFPGEPMPRGYVIWMRGSATRADPQRVFLLYRHGVLFDDASNATALDQLVRTASALSDGLERLATSGVEQEALLAKLVDVLSEANTVASRAQTFFSVFAGIRAEDVIWVASIGDVAVWLSGPNGQPITCVLPPTVQALPRALVAALGEGFSAGEVQSARIVLPHAQNWVVSSEPTLAPAAMSSNGS